MATIGEELKATELKRTQERIERRSAALRKFVKEDLLAALRLSIDLGHSDYAPVMAPKDISHLFVAPLEYSGTTPYNDPASPYNDVWRELDEWAESEGLFIRTGHDMDKSQKGGVPWDRRPWGGSLGILTPKPVKPTPPPLQVVSKGVPSSAFIAGAIAAILVLIVIALGAFT